VIYLLGFIGLGLTAIILGIDTAYYFADGYLLLFLSLEMFSFFIALLYYLYYGYKVNSYSSELEKIVKNLLGLYDFMLDTVDEVLKADDIQKDIPKSRQAYLAYCFVKQLRSNEKVENLHKAAIDKLHKLKEKGHSVLQRLQEDSKQNVYKFCGVLECSHGVYQALFATLASVVLSSVVRYIDKV